MNYTKFTACIECKQAFTRSNVFTAAGWRETQISGMCEKCFDNLFADLDEYDYSGDDEPAF